MKTEEYWKIREFKEYLTLLLSEINLRCNVTRSEIHDVQTKIKLMQEAQAYGEKKNENMYNYPSI